MIKENRRLYEYEYEYEWEYEWEWEWEWIENITKY